VKLTRTRALLPRVDWHPEVGSTNAELRDLIAREGDAVPHGALVATANQVAGRGRLGRGWQTPPNAALAMSLLIRNFGVNAGHQAGAAGDEDQPPLPVSWLPLLAGSAVSASLQGLFRNRVDEFGDPAPLRVGVKWPNDVHVRDEDDAMAGRPGRKLCGILCEVVSVRRGSGGSRSAATVSGADVIVGMGINLLIPEWELPTERSTSVLASGGETLGAADLADAQGQELVDRVMSEVAAELLELIERTRENPAAVRTRVKRDSLTLGTEVRVHLPDTSIVDGRAVGLDDDGALEVDLPTGGRLTVNAADIEHLR